MPPGPTVRPSGSSPQGTLGDPGRACLVHVEPAASLMLAQRVPDRAAPVLGPEYMNFVRLPPPASRVPNHFARLHLDDVDIEGNSLHAELNRLAEQLLRALGSVEAHRLGARLQPQRPDQPDHTEKMIGMKMREEDLRQRKAHPVTHHLALGAFAALE